MQRHLQWASEELASPVRILSLPLQCVNLRKEAEKPVVGNARDNRGIEIQHPEWVETFLIVW